MGNRTMFRNWNIRGGVNFLEHASPHDYLRDGIAISRMEKVIEKFREYGQTPNVYLFRLGLDRGISAVIYKLYQLGLLKSGNIFFYNTTNIHFTTFVYLSDFFILII